MISVTKILLLVLFVVCAVILLVYVFQRNLLFPMPSGDLPGTLPSHVEKIDLTEGYGLFVMSNQGDEQQKPLVFFSHGNAELAFWSLDAMSFFTDLGFHVLLFEYPGYGGANGKPGRESIKKAALEAYDQVVTRTDVDPNRIIIYGRSIGGGAAALLASRRPAAALILESTFSSLSALVAEKGFPSLLLRDRFDNDTIVADLEIPVFLYHGSKDNLIPVEHSERLALLAEDATFVTVPCGHNNCPRPWVQLEQFLVKQGFVTASRRS